MVRVLPCWWDSSRRMASAPWPMESGKGSRLAWCSKEVFDGLIYSLLRAETFGWLRPRCSAPTHVASEPHQNSLVHLRTFHSPRKLGAPTLLLMNKQLVAASSRSFKAQLTPLVACLFAATWLCVECPAALAQSTTVAMDAEHWQTESGVFEKIQGIDALALHTGEAAAAKGLTLRNGTVEFDVQPLAMGAGLAFRQRDNDTFESFYIRPNGKCPDDARCLQYAPQTHGILLWDLFPQYQTSAPIRDGEWNHIKVVLSGKRMNVYVNHGKTPALKIGRLEGDTAEGNLLLTGPGYFANFTVAADATEGLPAEPEADPTSRDANLVRAWQLSPATELEPEKNPSFEQMPASSAGWQPIRAERGGLVNISRQYGLPIARPRRSLAWLKTTITSDRAQTIHTSMGWVREVWVFVNGKLVYSDKNLFMPPAGRKSPDGRCSLTNGSFELPLNAGRNEVAIAVASGFYGMAVIVRPDDVKGLQFAGD
jgi:hypothetical protein